MGSQGSWKMHPNAGGGGPKKVSTVPRGKAEGKYYWTERGLRSALTQKVLYNADPKRKNKGKIREKENCHSQAPETSRRVTIYATDEKPPFRNPIVLRAQPASPLVVEKL